MYRMAVIGEPWMVMAFAGLGLETFEAETLSLAREAMDKAGKEFGIIFVSETFHQLVSERIKNREEQIPLVCLIPSGLKRENRGHELIKDAVRQAVGFDIG